MTDADPSVSTPPSSSRRDEDGGGRTAILRGRADHLWTLLFCLDCCVDALAGCLRTAADEAEAAVLHGRIGVAKAAAADTRQRLVAVDRLLAPRRAAAVDELLVGHVVWGEAPRAGRGGD